MKSRLSLVVGLSLICASSAAAQFSPEKTLKSFKVSDGLEISVWASEQSALEPQKPFLVNPTCMDVDHRGRVWICESINYRQKLRGEKKMRRPEGDRIVVFEDTKGAGQADKLTVFYQAPEIHAPLGIAVLPHLNGVGCTVYVCQTPDIMVFEDKDGDAKADGPPRKLLTGFKGLDHDHGVHGILIGPDNKLYFTVGDQGVSNLQSSDGKGPKYNTNGTDCRAATVWRCDLDGKNLELIAHNFRNNYEPCVDSFGTVFLSDNDDDGNQQTRLCYVMTGGDYGYHRTPKTSHWNEEHPGIVPKILRTYFGSPTGMCVYDGTLLPKKYLGQPLHVDAGPRHARCYHVTPSGAAYKVEREDMVESTDTWFRPSDICVAPDGSIYIADWYDPGVGGHGMGDTTRGRVYRLAPAGHKPFIPPLDLTSNAGITSALASPNLAVRAAAMAKLREQGVPKALEVLDAAAVQQADPILRARALWQLGYLGSLRHVVQAFADPDPNFRVLAMRILHDARGQTPIDYIADWQTRLLQDSSSAVRREALLLLQKADPAKAAPMILELAKQYDGKDRFYLCAVGIAIGHHDQKRRAAVLAGFDKSFPELNDKVAGLLWEVRPPQLVAMLDKQLSNAKLTPHQRNQVVEILALSDDVKAGQALLGALRSDLSAEVRQDVLASLQRNVKGKWSSLRTGPEINQAIDMLLKTQNGKSAALALIEMSGQAKWLDQVVTLARNAKAPESLRVAATQALGGIKDAQSAAVLAELLKDSRAALPIRIQAVKALDLVSVLGALADPSYPLELRQTALAVVAGHKPGAEQLLKRHADKTLDSDLTPDLARLLRNSPFPDIKKCAQAQLPAPPKLDPKKLPSIQALLVRKGNVERGESVLAKTLKNEAACLKCHTINKEGGNVGPELSVIGSKVSKENLLESILYPSRAVADQYIQWVVETKGGQVINGLLVEETPDFVVLRDVNAKDHKVNRKDVESRTKAPTSIMPDNLLLYISEDELLDMIEYLYSLKSPPLAPAN